MSTSNAWSVLDKIEFEILYIFSFLSDIIFTNKPIMIYSFGDKGLLARSLVKIGGMAMRDQSLEIEPRYSWNGDMVYAIVGEQAIILNEVTGQYVTLNPTATAVWGLLNQEMPQSAILSAMRARYRAPRGEIEQDTIALLSRLVAEGIIRERRETQ